MKKQPQKSPPVNHTNDDYVLSIGNAYVYASQFSGRYYLYLDTPSGWSQIGQKIEVPEQFDVKTWLFQSLQKRVKTRLDAIERLEEELERQKIELGIMASALVAGKTKAI